jgi:hypothetical protein
MKRIITDEVFEVVVSLRFAPSYKTEGSDPSWDGKGYKYGDLTLQVGGGSNLRQ